METFVKNRQYTKFCLYGFLKNLRFYDTFLLIFLVENEISYSEIGILYASREIITNVFEIPSGLIADTYGRKHALLAAFFLYIISYVVFYFSTEFHLLLIAMLLIGIGDAFRSGTHKGMIMDYLRIHKWGQHKITYYGYTRSWSQKGSALSALFAGIMVFYSGSYRIIYLISIIPYLLNFVNIYTYPNELNYSLKGNAKGRTPLKSVLRNIMVTLKKKRVLEILNSSALHAAFLKSIKDYIQPLMLNIALLIPIMATIDSKSKSGLIVGIIYFFIFLLTSYASKKSGKISSLAIANIERKTLFLGLFSGFLCGVLFHYQCWLLSLLLFVVIYMIENVRKPILTGFLADNVPNEILASVISTQSFYKTFITAALSVSIGVLADIYGIGIALLVVSGFLLLNSILLMFTIALRRLI